MPREGTVLLVHGLWLRGLAMWPMQRRLERCGYAVRAYTYPSMRLTLEENAERLCRYCHGLTGGKLHLVGHSMGGLVALGLAQRLPPQCRSRVVLIGSPFGESFAARALQRLPGGRAMLGRSMGQWLAVPHATPFDACELGVIAGNGGMGLGRLIAPGLPKPHDGVVNVEETRVPGMRDHIVLPVSHTQMLLSGEVVRQVCAFLEHGKFDRMQRSQPSVN
jgi:pimeloyl-ACP methyl ester carboxylesterase